MPSVIELFGWFVFNIAIPLFAPLALLQLIRMSNPRPERFVGIVRFATRDGQLLWAVIPMSANGCYALAAAGHLQKPDTLIWFVMAVQMVVVVTACVLATFATVDAFHADLRKRRGALPERHFPLIWIVVILIGAVSNLVGYVRLAHAAASL